MHRHGTLIQVVLKYTHFAKYYKRDECWNIFHEHFSACSIGKITGVILRLFADKKPMTAARVGFRSCSFHVRSTPYIFMGVWIYMSPRSASRTLKYDPKRLRKSWVWRLFWSTGITFKESGVNFRGHMNSHKDGIRGRTSGSDWSDHDWVQVTCFDCVFWLVQCLTSPDMDAKGSLHDSMGPNCTHLFFYIDNKIVAIFSN